jgi:hypothetical protein
MAEASSQSSTTDEAVPKISSTRILTSIQKMLDEIRLLPLSGSEFEVIKSDVNLACNIIEKTDQNGFLAIINRFYNYYTSNKRAFLERSEELIQPDLPLTKKICISIGPVIKSTGGKTSEMWRHLTLVFYLISLYKNQPDQKLKQLLKEVPFEDDDDEEEKSSSIVALGASSATAGGIVVTDDKEATRDALRKKLRRKRRGEEEDVIADVVKTVSSGINGPIDDPMQALACLTSSGGLQKIMGTLQTAMSSGRVKPKRMLNTVHQMLSNLTSELPDDDEDDDDDHEKK